MITLIENLIVVFTLSLAFTMVAVRLLPKPEEY